MALSAIWPRSAGIVRTAAGSEIGNAITSTQLMTSQPGICAVSRPEKA